MSEVAERLRADLGRVGDSFVVDVVETASWGRFMAPAGPFELTVLPGVLPEMILVKLRGSDESGGFAESMWFMSAEGFAEQVAGRLDQLQDFVTVETHESWPLCRQHDNPLRPEDGHPLRPEVRSGFVVWVCPETEVPVAEFGGLTAAES